MANSVYKLRTEIVKDVSKLAADVTELQKNPKVTESEKAAIMALEPILSDLVKALCVAPAR